MPTPVPRVFVDRQTYGEGTVTKRQQTRCPGCGARVDFTDSECMSCGVGLDEGGPGGEAQPPQATPPVVQRRLAWLPVVQSTLVGAAMGWGLAQVLMILWAAVSIVRWASLPSMRYGLISGWGLGTGLLLGLVMGIILSRQAR